MSFALQLLIGGALFYSVQWAAGLPGVYALAIVLFLVELAHDVRLFGHDRRVAYRRWRRWQ